MRRLTGLTAAIIFAATLSVMAQGGLGILKVLLCHLPPGNPANLHNVTVGEPAVATHLAHGDFLGACRPNRSASR